MKLFISIQMLQEGGNEIDGEVVANERVMCRMAYLVARTWPSENELNEDASQIIRSKNVNFFFTLDLKLN